MSCLTDRQRERERKIDRDRETTSNSTYSVSSERRTKAVKCPNVTDLGEANPL